MRGRYFVGAIAGALVLGLGIYWTYLGQQLIANEQELRVAEISTTQAAEIERRLSRSLSTTDILEQEVIQTNGKFPDFESYAAEVIASIGGVSNLQLAPGGIVQKIHPLAGNEKAIGHNILVDDKHRLEARTAITNDTLTLAGPFELVQGRIAVIGRNPVFIGDGQDRTFWGFTSALIFLDDLLEVTDLESLESGGYGYTLSRVEPSTGETEIFARSAADLDQNNHRHEVEVPNGTWILTMSKHDATASFWQRNIGYAASAVAAVLVAWITMFLMAQPERLQRVVSRKTDELRNLAFNDPVTGLANRRRLIDDLDTAVTQAQANDTHLAFLFIDLDEFKQVNDTLGHQIGDQLLEIVGQRIRSCLRNSDLVARLGGDEFGVLLYESSSPASAAKIADKITTSLHDPIKMAENEVLISASIGITMLPEDAESADQAFRNADLALYSAKESGKNTYTFFDQDLEAKIRERTRITRGLRSAIADEELVLHYQPQYELRTGDLSGMEALIRWDNPDLGLLMPDSFINVAEDSGVIVDLGYWVVAETCHTLQDCKRQGIHCTPIAVNLSPRQFTDPLLATKIQEIVARHDVDPTLIELEITESTIMADVKEAKVILDRLKRVGMTVAIDDFGTGYSSLALLRDLPVDRVKIDRSFMETVTTDPENRKLVHAIVSMAHALNLEVVSEGVETEDQLRLLRDIGSDYVQGFLFSRAVPASELPTVSRHLDDPT